MEGFSMDGMSTQAQQIWSMLDDMAESNPAAYRKFIDKQLQDGKEQMALPEPYMCVQVLLLTKPKGPLYVNFCSWNRIPEPKSPEEAVPVSGTPITQEVDEKGKFALTSVAFNPKVLEEFGREAKNPADADTLIQLALDYVEHEQKVKVGRSYTVLPKDMTHKGDMNLVKMTFTNLLNKGKNGNAHQQRQQPYMGEFEEDINRLEKKFGSSSLAGAGSAQNGQPQSVLSQLSNMTVNGGDSSDNARAYGNSHSDGGRHGISIFGDEKKTSKPKTRLIEEVGSTRLPCPKHSLEPVAMETGRALVLKVTLPDVKGVSECELDISEDDVELTVPGRYELKVKLPSCIDEDEASAKFSKKLSTLTVTMPVKS